MGNHKQKDREKRSNDTINYIKHNDNKITDKEEIANNMNKFFCEIGQKLSDDIVKPSNAELRLPDMNPNSIFLKPTNTNEVKSIINALKIKNGGVDKINAKTLKVISNHIALPLSHIFNLCIEKSIWPDALKKAEIIPVHKAGVKYNITNYRPISLISNLAKVFERIIYNRLYDFIQKHSIISKHQFGFMKNIGSKNALNYITNILYNNVDKTIPTIVTFLDLAKAFDTVDHKLLLDKLFCIGIRGQALDLLSSYLNNRYQMVKIDGKESDSLLISTGVPQGTILGPLLFIIYINDVLKEIPLASILSYADDTAVIATGDTWHDAQENMNEFLLVIYKWLAVNKLSLNVDKTVCMTFGSYRDSVPRHIDVKIMNRQIARVENYKYLGIVFDFNLKWDRHIQYIIKKTKYLVYIFYKLSNYMTSETLRMVYYAFFHSIISYGIVAWGGAYRNNRDLLQNLQRKILKIINKNTFYTQDNPPNLEQLFTFEALKIHYSDLKTKFENSTSVTRNKSLILPKNNKRVSDKKSYNKAIITYNSLPNELKILDINKVSAKSKIKKWIKSET